MPISRLSTQPSVYRNYFDEWPDRTVDLLCRPFTVQNPLGARIHVSPRYIEWRARL